MQADMGGTELLGPLRDIFKTPVSPTHPRQVFVLTDGQLDSIEPVVQATKAAAPTHRLFTLGIGFGVSKDLVIRLANAGNGTYEFILDADGIAAKVIRQLSRALQPSYSNLTIDWSKLFKRNSSVDGKE